MNRVEFRECPYRSYMYHIIDSKKTDNIFRIGNKRISQFELFRIRSKYRFLLSPLGNGLDCHRTWEGILFGMIIIVKTSPLDILYKIHNLPVVIVNDWTDINKTMLDKWYQQYKVHFIYNDT